MGARRSPQLAEGVRLLLEGKTAYRAAQLSGVTASAIRQTKEYQKLRDSKRQKTGVGP